MHADHPPRPQLGVAACSPGSTCVDSALSSASSSLASSSGHVTWIGPVERAASHQPRSSGPCGVIGFMAFTGCDLSHPSAAEAVGGRPDALPAPPTAGQHCAASAARPLPARRQLFAGASHDELSSWLATAERQQVGVRQGPRRAGGVCGRCAHCRATQRDLAPSPPAASLLPAAAAAGNHPPAPDQGGLTPAPPPPQPRASRDGRGRFSAKLAPLAAGASGGDHGALHAAIPPTGAGAALLAAPVQFQAPRAQARPFNNAP